jgi:hypothetical protein
MSEETPLTSTGQALRATSDTLLADLEHLTALERDKRHLIPGDPRTAELSAEIEKLAEQVLRGSTEERVLSEEAAVEVVVEGPHAPNRPIEDVPPRSPHVVLEAWREAERRAKDAIPGSPEAAALGVEIERLRLEYRRAHELVLRKYDRTE